jgi:sugar fermentation stimulation protein A
MKLASEGHTAEILFVVQRENVTKFRPADHIDAEYGRLLRQATDRGVIVRALACHIDPAKGVRLTATPLALDF